MFKCNTQPLLTTGADPVMAEYITIMLINNKTKGMCTLNGSALVVNNHLFVQTRYLLNSRIVSHRANFCVGTADWSTFTSDRLRLWSVRQNGLETWSKHLCRCKLCGLALRGSRERRARRGTARR